MAITSRHELSALDRDARTAVCSLCGPVDVYRMHKGNGTYGFTCGPGQRVRVYTARQARRDRVQLAKRPYLVHRVGRCERCGRVPLMEAALSVHHIDGDRTNGRTDNLQTLCLTCHAEVHALLRAQEDAELDLLAAGEVAQ